MSATIPDGMLELVEFVCPKCSTSEAVWISTENSPMLIPEVRGEIPRCYCHACNWSGRIPRSEMMVVTGNQTTATKPA